MSTDRIHTFAGLPLDRSYNAELKTAEAFKEALCASRSRFILVHGSKALIDGAKLVWLDPEQLKASLRCSEADLTPQTQSASPLPCILLGTRSDSGRSWVFTVDITTSRQKDEVEENVKDVLSRQDKTSFRPVFTPVRSLMAAMDGEEIALAGQGAALATWHRQHSFCGTCAAPMLLIEGGSRRACTRCNNRVYPRVDPVIIALVYHPATDSCLLGRQSVYPTGMYSCLAGYAEQCETLEEAVRREVKEESGIEVSNLSYHSSQPWPIGRGSSCQLMCGFMAEATSTEIRLDPEEEMEDVRWVTREQLTQARELLTPPSVGSSMTQADGGAGQLTIPGPYAIANHLLKYWLRHVSPKGRL